MSDWDNLVEPTRGALEALLRKGDEMADRIEELEAKLGKATIELKMMIDVSTFMQSSACYDKRRHHSSITDTMWQQWSQQLKFAKSTLAEMKEQNDE